MSGALRQMTARKRAAGGWTPASVSGLHVWFKADAITGKVDGDTVSTWADSSGNGRTATAPAGQEPTYKTSILNGQPVVRFSASSTKRMATAAWTALSQPYTVFIVGSTKNTAFSQLLDGIASGNRVAYYRHTSDNDFDVFAGSSSVNTLSSMSTNRIHTLVVNGASTRARHNGGAGVGLNSGTHTLTGLTLANRFDATFESGGDMAELLLYTGAVSLSDMNLVGDYLATKYGLTWSTAT